MTTRESAPKARHYAFASRYERLKTINAPYETIVATIVEPVVELGPFASRAARTAT